MRALCSNASVSHLLPHFTHLIIFTKEHKSPVEVSLKGLVFLLHLTWCSPHYYCSSAASRWTISPLYSIVFKICWFHMPLNPQYHKNVFIMCRPFYVCGQNHPLSPFHFPAWFPFSLPSHVLFSFFLLALRVAIYDEHCSWTEFIVLYNVYICAYHFSLSLWEVLSQNLMEMDMSQLKFVQRHVCNA